jgi:hypothetical protein
MLERCIRLIQSNSLDPFHHFLSKFKDFDRQS